MGRSSIVFASPSCTGPIGFLPSFPSNHDQQSRLPVLACACGRSPTVPRVLVGAVVGVASVAVAPGGASVLLILLVRPALHHVPELYDGSVDSQNWQVMADCPDRSGKPAWPVLLGVIRVEENL